MKISIIVAHHQTPELLDLCLDSVKKTIQKLDYEIIVICSESREKDEEFIKNKWPEVNIVSFKKNTGYSKLINAGINVSTGDFILILNADIIVLDGAISEMIKYFEANKDVGIIAPRLEDYTGNLQVSCFNDPVPRLILARRTFWGK
ncbi:MAG: glycosyltransferase, partial [Candidatus Portnoybacteria bacterium]|nr:glycosyltransferase [Candidatus Portnoybacteria bacterium]